MENNEKTELEIRLENLEAKFDEVAQKIAELQSRIKADKEARNKEVKNDLIDNRLNAINLKLPKSISESFGTINSPRNK
jgi:predicted nuclease with TOPRIM domain